MHTKRRNKKWVIYDIKSAVYINSLRQIFRIAPLYHSICQFSLAKFVVILHGTSVGSSILWTVYFYTLPIVDLGVCVCVMPLHVIDGWKLKGEIKCKFFIKYVSLICWFDFFSLAFNSNDFAHLFGLSSLAVIHLNFKSYIH